jgi:hypothetical protein
MQTPLLIILNNPFLRGEFIIISFTTVNSRLVNISENGAKFKTSDPA